MIKINLNSQFAKYLLYAVENITAILFGLVGMSLVARVFGPENMGRLSLVQSVSAIFIFLATFGLDHFIVREFSQHKNDGELKGSLLFLKTIGWFFYLAALCIYFAVNGNVKDELFLILSVAISTYFIRVLFFNQYLQATNDALPIALSAVISRLFALAFLVFGTFKHFSYDLMVMYLPIQAAIQALILFFGYRQSKTKLADNNQIAPYSVNLKRIFLLVKEASPVMFAMVLYYAYSQADIMIVSHFLSIKEVGIYAAAMRLVPQAVFIGHITVMTFYGTINQLYLQDHAQFTAYATKIIRVQIAIGLLLSIVLCVLAPLVIWMLYGEKYSESAPILSIGVWAWVFMLPACLLTRLLILAKLSKYELLKAMIVAPISIGLNILLIPQFGAMAAAWVFVAAFLLGDFLVYGLFKETRFLCKIWCDGFTSLVQSPIVSLKETIALFKHQP